MTLLQALLLGVVQGATEFIPVSSSGHLVLVPWLLGWDLEPGPTFVFDVLVQWGTLVAVVVYFWQDLAAMAEAVIRDALAGRPFASSHSRLAWLLLMASVPAAAAGYLAKEHVERAFTDPGAVSAFLLLTAALLALSERVGSRRRQLEDVRAIDAVWIGLAQVLALFPGVSRSGATIAGGLSRDLKRPAAARFSFLMSLPIMLGAGLLAMMDLAAAPDVAAQLPPLVAGFLMAAIVGYLSIRWLISYLTRQPLTLFIVYCTVVGTLGLIADVLL